MTNNLPFTVTLPDNPNGEILLEITQSDIVVKYYIQVIQTNLKIRVGEPRGFDVVPGENGEIFLNTTHLN
jgi:hypothetical protein